MKKREFLTKFVWALVTILASLSIISLLPEPNMMSCGFMGQCLTWYEFWDGFFFVFLCLVFGPKRILFIVFILVFTMFWSVISLFISGETQPQMIFVWLPAVVYAPLFHGGLIGGAIAYFVNHYLAKYRHKLANNT